MRVFTSKVIVRTMRATITRRLLVNATVTADAVRPLLPPGCVPAAVAGTDRTLVGVCVLRVDDLRPEGVPNALGRSFEGLAHRIAIRRPDGSPGVHIVRRETADRLALLVGGRLFPGAHHPIELERGRGDLELHGSGHGGPTFLVRAVDEPPSGEARSVLGDDAAASAFFAVANIASSPSRRAGFPEVLRMEAPPFVVRAVGVREVVLDRLAWALGDVPPSALSFDSAFVARDVPVRFAAPTAA